MEGVLVVDGGASSRKFQVLPVGVSQNPDGPIKGKGHEFRRRAIP